MASSLSRVIVSTPASVKGVVCVTVAAETLMYLGHNVLPTTLWCLVD